MRPAVMPRPTPSLTAYAVNLPYLRVGLRRHRPLVPPPAVACPSIHRPPMLVALPPACAPPAPQIRRTLAGSWPARGGPHLLPAPARPRPDPAARRSSAARARFPPSHPKVLHAHHERQGGMSISRRQEATNHSGLWHLASSIPNSIISIAQLQSCSPLTDV